MRRFEIAQDSMRPNFNPGDEVVAIDTRRPKIGDAVVFPHPGRDDFWVIKRVSDPPRPIETEEVWVLSDDPDVTLADSRTLGPLPREIMWTVIDRLDPEAFVQACGLLADEDDALGRVIERHGLPEFWERRPGFATLVWLILEQQVSLESGAAMYRRLHGRAGSIDPGALLDLGPEAMREIGVTRQKTSYLIELADGIQRGRISLEALDDLPEKNARDALLEVKGIGPWTADAYLLSALRHPDVFPVGDRALQVGTGETLGMGEIPDAEELEIISEPWKPVRAAAARLIWHAYLSLRGRVEPADPTTAHDPPGDA